MTDRVGAVFAPKAAASVGGGAAPPGVDRDEFRLALLEDTYEVVAGLELVRPALILADGDWPEAEAVTWPGTPVVHAGDLAAALEGLRRLGADEAVVVAGDAPDLPPLLIGKLFRALGRAQAAGCLADGGGLVALAVPLPAPSWLFHRVAASGFGLFDLPDAFQRLRAAAPRPGLVQAGPGWHRLRAPADLGVLDPGLEGWESTRALLSGRPLS
ncbi:MAG TPA: hypothetical protein VFU43_12185 [Streptosporangiaceae bacterium]|nr:hypothetical protein [Streptosporangiaceae bacterium]